jgi:hypothetical protein
MRKSVGQAPTAGEQTQQKPCRTSSDIGAELENHTVGRGRCRIGKGKNKVRKLLFPTYNRVMLRSLFTGLTPQRVQFNLCPIHMEFVLIKVAFVQIFLNFLDARLFYSDNPA